MAVREAHQLMVAMQGTSGLDRLLLGLRPQEVWEQRVQNMQQ